VVPSPSNRSMSSVLGAWAVVVLEAAVPRYARRGWGGTNDGHGREKGPERTTLSNRHTTFSGDIHKR
jgi:hypothetical protein